jgi:hypothetical protein
MNDHEETDDRDDDSRVIRYRHSPDAITRARQALAEHGDAAKALDADPSLSAFALLQALTDDYPHQGEPVDMQRETAGAQVIHDLARRALQWRSSPTILISRPVSSTPTGSVQVGRQRGRSVRISILSRPAISLRVCRW